jgi:hypothetical protein
MAENHDSIYHRLFSYPVMVENTVRAFIPEIGEAGFSLEGMERVSAKFHADRDGDRREGDVIWRLRSRDRQPAFLILLLEFQSRDDRLMAVRTLVYQGLLWQQLIKEGSVASNGMLPPVFTVVLHNGDQRWKASTDVKALIDLPQGSPLWAWQPQARYFLLDMTSMPIDKLGDADNLAALLVRLERGNAQPVDLLPLLNDLIALFRRHPEHAMLQSLFREMLRRTIRATGTSIPVPDELMEIKTMLETQGERWVRDWTAKGRAEGKAEGKADTLLRLLRRRFGDVSPDMEARVQATNDISTLDDWFDRAIDATTLDDVFGGTPH